jgi:hypothetical protein
VIGEEAADPGIIQPFTLPRPPAMDRKSTSARNGVKAIAAGFGMLLFVAVLYVASAGPALRWTGRKRWEQIYAPVDHVARTRGPVGQGLMAYLSYWDPWIEVGGTGSIEEFSLEFDCDLPGT